MAASGLQENHSEEKQLGKITMNKVSSSEFARYVCFIKHSKVPLKQDQTGLRESKLLSRRQLCLPEIQGCIIKQITRRT